MLNSVISNLKQLRPSRIEKLKKCYYKAIGNFRATVFLNLETSYLMFFFSSFQKEVKINLLTGNKRLVSRLRSQCSPRASFLSRIYIVAK